MKSFVGVVSVFVVLAILMVIGLNQPPIANSPVYHAPLMSDHERSIQDYVHFSNRGNSIAVIVLVGLLALLFRWYIFPKLRKDPTADPVYTNMEPEVRTTEAFTRSRRMARWQHPGH